MSMRRSIYSERDKWGAGGGADGKRVREEEREAKCSERCVYVCAL